MFAYSLLITAIIIYWCIGSYLLHNVLAPFVWWVKLFAPLFIVILIPYILHELYIGLMAIDGAVLPYEKPDKDDSQ